MRFIGTCRLCKDKSTDRTLLKYGVRHYCHPECGFAKWGDEMLRMIPAHEVGQIPYRLFIGQPGRLALAKILDPRLTITLEALS